MGGPYSLGISGWEELTLQTALHTMAQRIMQPIIYCSNDFKTKRPCISPNLHFMGQLLEFLLQFQKVYNSFSLFSAPMLLSCEVENYMNMMKLR